MSKIDQQIELALAVPEKVLESDTELETGYLGNKLWELIIKYSGDIEFISKEMNITVEPLLFGYGIVIIDEALIDKLASYPQIEYIEKPRRLYFEINEAKKISCINSVQNDMVQGLYGEGVIVAVIDSGIDYAHRDFRNEDGTTRILNIWDQTVSGKPPKGYIVGTEYSSSQINQALMQPTKEDQLKIVNSIDISGHGTHVTGIACGNGKSSNGEYAGVAPKSDIIIVKIGNSIGDAYPKTSRLMEAIDYVIKKSIEYNKPVAINLSFGNNYGSHTGRSILEQYIDDAALAWKCNICIGSGNEGEASNHVQGILREKETIELLIGERQNYVSMQIWKNYSDNIRVELVSPSGNIYTINENINQTVTYNLNDETIYVYYGEPTPIEYLEEINIIIYPNVNYLQQGIWKINMIPIDVIDGNYDIWLGSDITINTNTFFLQSSKYKTLTIPSTAYRAITVGAYNGYTDSYVAFSGIGAEVYNFLGKPDIVAPGVNITSTAVNGGYEVRTGTSMATPIVTGSVALMMEWGIVRENDLYLYGEKMKAYIIKGARRLYGFNVYPNPYVGWGALCLSKSFPR